MSKIYTTKKFPFNYNGLLSYRIEFDITNKNRPLQRHIWTKEDGSERFDEWINSGVNITKEKLYYEGCSLSTNYCPQSI